MTAMKLSYIGQYLKMCKGQIVDFLGSELQRFGPCHIVFFIKKRPNNYSKVTVVDRNESVPNQSDQLWENVNVRLWRIRKIKPFFTENFYFRPNT